MEKSIKAINEELLSQISGGQLTQMTIDTIDDVVKFYKAMNIDLDQVKQYARDAFKSTPELFTTDGSQEDLQEYLKMLEEAWNK